MPIMHHINGDAKNMMFPVGVVYISLSKNIPLSEITKDLGVHRSTISREIKRNTAPDFKGLYC